MDMNLIFTDNSRFRAAQIMLKDITSKLNEVFGAQITLQLSFLLSEVTLVNGTTAYKFPLLTTEIDNTVFPLSYGVQQNDVFIGIDKEFTVDNRPATTSALIEAQTYYNKQVFTAANTSTPGHIQALWNAIWNYQVGNKTYIQNQFTRRDLRQPITQQSSANNWPSYAGNRLPGIDPYILVSGKATQYFNFLIQQAGFAGGATGGTFNVLSLYMQGFTLQNGAGFVRFYTGDLDIETYYQEYLKQNANLDESKWQPLKAQDSFGNLM